MGPIERANLCLCGFCLRFQVEPTQVDPIERANLSASGPETEISSFYCSHLSKVHLKMETEFTLRNVVFQIKDRKLE
jgi:hypothetical protein